MGQGLKELQFDIDGGPVHIQKVIMEKYQQLDAGGGYSLLRLAKNSHKLEEIETANGGLTVPYLKDIVRQAKLYIRPLQCEIEGDDVKPTVTQVRQQSSQRQVHCCTMGAICIQITEPEEKCLKCNCTMPLSVLMRHVKECGCRISVDLTQ